MNQFGLTLVWCAIQVTIVTCVASTCYLLVRRHGPAIGATVVLAGLFLVLGLTPMAFSRWPNWNLLRPNVSETVANVPAVRAEASEDPTEGLASRQGGSTAWSSFFGAFWDELRIPPAEAPRATSGMRWPEIVAWCFAAAVIMGLVRLLAGLGAVRVYRHGSHAIRDDPILELSDVLRAEIGCRRDVELRESEGLSTAATVGWHRPVILLPTQWRSWNHAERRAVLAHELAHIHRQDYATWAAAQCVLLLHFYHPLVHGLVRWLRLDQELAADAVAARLSGGSRPYLTTLADMALRQPDRPMSWPARSFLPTRRTFLRRIEMLRDPKQVELTSSSRTRNAALAAVLAAGLVAVGIRPGGPGSPESTAAEPFREVSQVTRTPASPARQPFSLAYVPRDAVGVVAVRPASLLTQPMFQPLAELLSGESGWSDTLGVEETQIEQALSVFLVRERTRAPEPALFILRLTTPQAAESMLEKLFSDAEKVSFAGQAYLQTRQQGLAFQADPRTLVLSDQEGYLRRAIIAGDSGAADVPWASDWQQVAGADATAILQVSMLSADMDRQLAQSPGPARAPLAMVAPLWKNISVATLQVTAKEELSLEAVGQIPDADKVAAVEATLSALITLGKNSLSQFRGQASQEEPAQAEIALRALDLADRVLEQAVVTKSEKNVTVRLNADRQTTAQLVQTMIPAVTAARAASERTKSMNNLKQLALAMLMYAHKHGHYPPAVVIGPDGQTPHSWRVALLQFLDEPLYRQYRLDEPWNSENNRKVLEQMPEFFKHPSAKKGSQETAYHVITGPNTVFSGNEGTSIEDITDGTSNTLLVVEAKRGIPWTKPEDVPLEDGKLPDLGGFHEQYFTAAFADGSVRIIMKSTDERMLRFMFMINDGESITNFDARQTPAEALRSTLTPERDEHIDEVVQFPSETSQSTATPERDEHIDEVIQFPSETSQGTVNPE